MQRRLFLASGAAAVLAGCSSSSSTPAIVNPATTASPDDVNLNYGSLLDASEWAAAPVAVPPRALPSYNPGSGAMLTNLPGITTQGTPPNQLGSPGSCEAQSFGYGIGSYTAARNADFSTKWNPAQGWDTNAQAGPYAVSAAWLYEWSINTPGVSNGACPGGTKATPYLRRLIRTGAPSAAQVPYQSNCAYLDTAYQQNPNPPNQSMFQIGAFANIALAGLSTSQKTQLLIDWLDAGFIIAFSGIVLKGYSRPANASGSTGGANYLDSRGVWFGTVGGGGHGQLIVGYSTALNAFLVQNSFGPAWPYLPSGTPQPAPNGMLYWDAGTLLNTQSYFAVGFPANTGPVRGTILQPTPTSGPVTAVRLSVYNGQTLVIGVDVAAPVELATVTVTPPSGTAQTISYNNPFYTGYLALSSTGGFAPGPYKIALTGTQSAGGGPYNTSGLVLLSS